METREEKLAKWADPSMERQQSFRFLEGSLPLNSNGMNNNIRISDDRIKFDQMESRLTNAFDNNDSGLWHLKVVSFPRLRPGRLAISISKPVFQKIQDEWGLHPRTIEVFLSNNGVSAAFHCPISGRMSLLLKVANSRSTGFDCVSVAWNPSHRTTYVLYHHLTDEDSIFATLLSASERCLDPHFFILALYRSHHQHIETHRNTIDDTIQAIERTTGFGNPGRLMGRRASQDGYPDRFDPRKTIKRLSYCQTDIAIIEHVARCCSESGGWLVRVIDEWLQGEPCWQNGENTRANHHQWHQQLSENLKAIRLMSRQDADYIWRRSEMLLSQVQQMKDRIQSQTTFMLGTVTQSDAEYTAAIAMDGKHDSIAMKTISILGIIYLPGTFVATLFSMDTFGWGGDNDEKPSSLKISPDVWIYWVTAVPLTVITFLVWIWWTRKEARKSRERLIVFRTNSLFELERSSETKGASEIKNSSEIKSAPWTKDPPPKSAFSSTSGPLQDDCTDFVSVEKMV